MDIFEKDTKKLAYTLSEILITFLIVSLVALLSAPLVAKKALKQKKEKTSHGTYACTRYGQNYYEFSSDKQISINQLDKNLTKWSNKNGCNFKVPKDADALKVLLIGPGGKGFDAGVDIEDGYIPEGDYSCKESSGCVFEYTVKKDGIYDITVFPGTGGDSSLGTWPSTESGVNCFADTAAGGDSNTYRIYKKQLKANDKVSVNFRSIGSRLTESDLEEVFGSLPNFTGLHMGKNGYVITTKINGETLVETKQAQSGSYTCEPNDESEICKIKCDPDKYPARAGFDSDVYKCEAANGCNEKTDYGEDTKKNYVTIKWSDDNNDVNKLIIPYYGWGGKAGEVVETVIPIFSNKSVTLDVGYNGTSTNYNGVLYAKAGANGTKISVDKDNISSNGYAGKKGDDLYLIDNTKFTGSNGGNSLSVNAYTIWTSSMQFGAGGGSGAIWYNSDGLKYDKNMTESQNKESNKNRKHGSGAMGGAGLILITW